VADWEIKKTLGQCCITQQAFEVGEEYFAALVETETGLERRDYSTECWHKERPPVYCFWRTRMPEADQKKKLFVDDEMLLTFFDRLADETEPEKVNFRFVLMLILMRKRRLKYEGMKTEGAMETWSLRVSGENRCVEVINPHLTEDKIEQLSSQMGQILQVDF